jgi:formylglycine-generating enzyme required for sulfatase activity/energy-coupling factor transporter ATP-binding protein EcfA2
MQIGPTGGRRDSVDVIGHDKNIFINWPGPSPLDGTEALKRYLDNLIDSHQHLHLQGIRAGGQPLSVNLEKVYISLTAVEKDMQGLGVPIATLRGAAAVVREGSGLPAGEQRSLPVNVALERCKRLVIIGDPGSGKTTLLTYLALTYARDLRDNAGTVQDRLKLKEQGLLPILLPLRDLGQYIKMQHTDPGGDGPALLIDYLQDYYAAQSIQLPKDFFARPLESNAAVILLDGMDEVADIRLRQRVARIIEKFAVRYPGNRFVVTSREVGYEGAARISAEFGLVKVRNFNPDEVRQFVHDWTCAIEITLAEHESPDIVRIAEEQAERLIRAIEGNSRISDLAVNPLLLTVIALVHRYRAALPERRSELYEEAVEVLLARWDEAKGLEIETMLAGRPLDAGDRRALLEPVAFWLHERQQREIDLDSLRSLLLHPFKNMAAGDAAIASKAVEAFLKLIGERSGLIIERGVGVYSFAHLTFQEYLAARAVADREDAISYTLSRLGSPWWREVILLEAGYLSTQGRRRVSELVKAIMDIDLQALPTPFYNLILAAECLYDVGPARIEGDLLSEVKCRLQRELEKSSDHSQGNRTLVLQRIAAANALSQIESGQFGGGTRFWKVPWGEPEWVTVQASEFWMGNDNGSFEERPTHRVMVETFQIARVPITNTQYALFLNDQKLKSPNHWMSDQPPKGTEDNPVVNVSYKDAVLYCRWLGEKIGRIVRLPTEAEWEKAARGDRDKRVYPWGDKWIDFNCNTRELRLDGISSVGLFPSGASPYGCLDMVGNVWEWTQSCLAPYPYEANDGRGVSPLMPKVIRGGSWDLNQTYACCTLRTYSQRPELHADNLGFRVIAFSQPNQEDQQVPK